MEPESRRLFRWSAAVWVCWILVAIRPGAAFAAQDRPTTGDLAGVVVDPSEARVPGAGVVVINTATNAQRTAQTDAEGRFSIPALQPGSYTVAVSKSGFLPQTRDSVTITLGSLIELTFTLQVAGVAETVAVVAPAPLRDAMRTVVSTVVSEDQIGGLPIDIRNFISFTEIVPGVSSDRTPQQGASATSGLTFAGQRGRSNNITVDGVDNNDLSVGAVRATFSQEAVLEFQVLANSYSAEFGKASGGVVNIVTRSGSNDTSGRLFGFFRDDALSAKAHFEKFSPAGEALNRSKAPYGQKQFGGVLGGPLKRDRTFYFLSLERLDVDASNFVTINDTDPVTLFGQTLGTPAEILRRAGFAVETGNVPYRVTSNQALGKVDQNLASKGQLSLRFNWAGALNENVEPWGGQVAKSRGAVLKSDDVMLAAAHVSVPSPRAVNELRGQVAIRDQTVESLDPTCSGECDRVDEGGPTLEISGVASVGRQRFTPQPRKDLRLQVLDTFSYQTGRHGLKAGFDYNSIDNRSSALPLHFGGRYIFAPLPAIPGVLPAPVSSIQALALGLPAAYVQGYGIPDNTFRSQDLSLLAEDNWTATPTLSLRLGVRYQNQFWPASQYTLNGVGSFSFPSDNNNVAPRLALAWAPRRDRKTSIHAAYGMYYDNQLTSLIGVSQILTGDPNGVRTLVVRIPGTIAAWKAPGHRLPEPGGTYPSLVYVPSPSLKTPYAHHVAVGINGEVRGFSVSGNFVLVRGRDQVGTLDYNPLVPSLGDGRRPEDVVNPLTGVPVAGSSTSILQPTSFGRSWYRGLTLAAERRFRTGSHVLASYTLSKAEDNSTDFQSAFVPQNMGAGRDPANPKGLPIGFNPNDERGPSLQDQRHRLVVSGLYALPADFAISAVATIASGRPYNVLAGVDRDGNGDGGAFPADRARRTPADPASTVGRNSGTLPWQAAFDVRLTRRFHTRGRAAVDGILEAFNLFNRTNYTEINNIFGAGAYPAQPLPTFGQFEQAGPPRQVQLGVRVSF